MKQIKCPDCGLVHETPIPPWQWRCPNCKMWIKVDNIGREVKSTRTSDLNTED